MRYTCSVLVLLTRFLELVYLQHIQLLRKQAVAKGKIARSSTSGWDQHSIGVHFPLELAGNTEPIDLLEPRIHELVAVKYGNLSAFYSRLISSSLLHLAVDWVGYGDQVHRFTIQLLNIDHVECPKSQEVQ